jgi:plastocyanin
MTRKRMITLVTALALAASGLAACGGDDEAEEPAEPPAATQPAETEAPGAETEPAETQPAEEAVEVAAEPGGGLAYEQSSLSASAGSVSFEFTNESSVPHDFNIERDGERVAATEIITDSQETLTADLEPGSYIFYCSVAGHRQGGMEGPLTVE